MLRKELNIKHTKGINVAPIALENNDATFD
jgi:hypothetical protein